MKSPRSALIRRYLHEHGPSSLAALAEATGASLPTLRRDLTEMERQGLVIRDHGGAALAETHLREAAFEARESQSLPEKRAIAAAAVGAGSMAICHVNDPFFWIAAHMGRLSPGRALYVISLGSAVMAIGALVVIAAIRQFI